jgi:hypothetical protein
MNKLSRSRLIALDEKLEDRRQINHALAVRRVELENRFKDNPEKVEDDLTIKNLKLFRESVDSLYDSLADEQKEIFDKRWNGTGNTWEEIAYELNYHPRTIYKKRTAILEAFAHILGEF